MNRCTFSYLLYALMISGIVMLVQWLASCF